MVSAIEWLGDPFLLRQGETWNCWKGCTQVGPECYLCLDPATRVLYADMTWKPIGDVRVGDVLVGFTETPVVGANRVFERATVEAVHRTAQPTVELTVGDRTIVTNKDHRWLGDTRPNWKTTATLRLGMNLKVVADPNLSSDVTNSDYRAGYIAGVTAGDGTMRWNAHWRSATLGYPQRYWRVAGLADDRAVLDRLVEYLADFGVDVMVQPFDGGPGTFRNRPGTRRPMMKVETRRNDCLTIIAGLLEERSALDWQAGWLAGIFDTEGTYIRHNETTNLRISQRKENGVLAAAERYASALGFALKREPDNTGCPCVRLYGHVEDQIGFLARIVPALTRKCEAFYGRRVPARTAEVNGIRRGPVRELVDIQTSTGTFVAEGVATHNCYITRTIPLRTARMTFDRAGEGGTTGLVYAPRERLYFPLTKRDPLIIFPESISDLWHELVPDERIADVWAVMLLADWHIFQTTTKRATRQCRLLNSAAFADLVAAAVEQLAAELGPRRLAPAAVDRARAHLAQRLPGGAMRPLPNVWIGVTAGCDQSAKTRLPYLDRTPAEVRWVSAEPVTQPDFNLGAGMRIRCQRCVGGVLRTPAPGGSLVCRRCMGTGWHRARIDYIIFGGESGPAYLVDAPDTGPGTTLRELTEDHLRYLIMQADLVGIGAISVKQLGTAWARHAGARHPKGGDPAEWPADLRIRQYPRQLAERALRVDPGNTAAATDLARAARDEQRRLADVF